MALTEIRDNVLDKIKDKSSDFEAISKEFEGLELLSDRELEEMERMYYRGLDMVKNIRIQKKYVEEIENLKYMIGENTKVKEGIENKSCGSKKSVLGQVN